MKKILIKISKIFVLFSLILTISIGAVWIVIEESRALKPFEPGIYQIYRYDINDDENVYSRVIITPISEEKFVSLQGKNVLEDKSKYRTNQYYHIHVLLIINDKEVGVNFENIKYMHGYYDEKNDIRLSVFRDRKGQIHLKDRTIYFRE